jgi:hypothetical protein
MCTGAVEAKTRTDILIENMARLAGALAENTAAMKMKAWRSTQVSSPSNENPGGDGSGGGHPPGSRRQSQPKRKEAMMAAKSKPKGKPVKAMKKAPAKKAKGKPK